MKKIIKEVNETVESSVSGCIFKVKDDKIEECVITIGENSRSVRPVKKIIIPVREIPKELLEAIDAFIDSRIDNEVIIDKTISIPKEKGKKKNVK